MLREHLYWRVSLDHTGCDRTPTGNGTRVPPWGTLPAHLPSQLLRPASSSLRPHTLTFLQDLQMFPQDVPDEVRGQLEKAVFPQCTESRSVHTELLEVHTLQAELVHSPHHPVPNMGFRPLPGV